MRALLAAEQRALADQARHEAEAARRAADEALKKLGKGGGGR
ncbi:MAG: hypothetical protein ACRC33_25000 [Gemmataceae bacterium]